MILTPDEQALTEGAGGPAAAMAMRIVAESGRVLGASALVAVASAHIDGALYHGDSGTEFAERLVEMGGKVAIPTTLNIGALDLMTPGNVRMDGRRRAMALRLMRAYERLGCRATWTCAPYQAGHRPAAGTDVAWGESNAVAFCNSVLGARTNRYGDFLDIACALVGRAPRFGLHLAENRTARIIVDVSGLTPALRSADVLYPVLGTLLGRTVGEEIAVIDGLAGFTDDDKLKALGAAAASSGAVALFHVAGVTPEAPSIAAAIGDGAGLDRLPRITVTGDMLRAALAAMSTTRDEAIDAIAVGSPHFSVAECETLIALLGGRRVVLPFYVNTGRHVLAVLAERGLDTVLEKAGITFVADTCVVATPILKDLAGGILMTCSGKFAHYAPGNTGYGVRYGSLADCVETAVSGRLHSDATLWQ